MRHPTVSPYPTEANTPILRPFSKLELCGRLGDEVLLDMFLADREKMSKQLAYARLGNKKTKRDLFASYKAEDVLVDELHPIIALFDQNREQEQKALAALSKVLNARLAERAADTESAGSEGAGPSSA